MPNALVPLASFTLTAAQQTITFTGIPQSGFKDLRLVVQGSATSNSDIQMRFNNDSAANYSFTYMGGNGSATVVGTAGGQTGCVMDAFYWRTTDLSLLTIDIVDFLATNKHKVALSRNNVPTAGTDVFSNRWASTAAINTLSIFQGAQWSAGSTFNLYGVL